MTRTEKSIELFFDETGDIYNNPRGVEIVWLSKNGVCVTAYWPGTEEEEQISLLLQLTCDDYSQFIGAFEISDAVREVIDNITTDTLWSLFQSGKCAVVCSIEEEISPTLEFYIREKRMIAKDENGRVNEVPVILKSPGEFIDYTKRYFEVDEFVDGFANHKSFSNPRLDLKCN